MITPIQVQSIVKQIARLSDAPMNEKFSDLGLNSIQLQRIQKRFIDLFHKTTKDIKFSDTIYSLTNKLNATNHN